MASIVDDPGGRRRILFFAPDHSRKTLRLGRIDRKSAESIARHIEELLAAKIGGQPIPTRTASWLAEIGETLHDKLAAVGLIEERQKAVTLSELLALYATEKEAENKPGTQTNHRTISNDLTGFFGADIDPRSITADSAKQFLDHLRERNLAAATVARRVRRVRSIFAFAVKKKLAPSNHFVELKTVSVLPSDRKAYVTATDAEKLTVAANPTWRVIIALARYAGLRCPSEVLSLKWSDVNFETGRMTVPSPKTEGIPGKEYRVCPVFTALRPHLEEAFELATEGAVYVVSGPLADRVRATSTGEKGWVNCNLRTQFERVIRRAGLTPWPRLFHTLRASCETDLLSHFPISAVTEWLGHSAAVALKHYTRVPDAIFERAAGIGAHGGAFSGAQAAHFPAQTGADGTEQDRTNPAELLGKQAFGSVLSDPVSSGPSSKVTLWGFEPQFLP